MVQVAGGGAGWLMVNDCYFRYPTGEGEVDRRNVAESMKARQQRPPTSETPWREEVDRRDSSATGRAPRTYCL